MYFGSVGALEKKIIQKKTRQSIFSVDCGNDFSLGIDENGKLWGWGRKLFLGFFEDGSQTEPVMIKRFKENNVIQTACGEGNL